MTEGYDPRYNPDLRDPNPQQPGAHEVVSEDEAFEMTMRYVIHTIDGGFFSYDELSEHLTQLHVQLPTEVEERNALLWQWLDEIEAIENEEAERDEQINQVQWIASKREGVDLIALATVDRTMHPANEQNKQDDTLGSKTEPLPPEHIVEPEVERRADVENLGRIATEATPDLGSAEETSQPELVNLDVQEQAAARAVLLVFAREKHTGTPKSPKQILRAIESDDSIKMPNRYGIVNNVSRRLVDLGLLEEVRRTRRHPNLRFTMTSKDIKSQLATKGGRKSIFLHIESGEPFEPKKK